MEKKAAKPREDQRVRLTKQMIQGAFLELLNQKSIQNITVKELCERAGVNRGTFYLHYHDVYDLLDQMQKALLAELNALLDGTPVLFINTPRETSGAFITALVQFFDNNRELCAVLLGENIDKKFLAAVIDAPRDKSVREYRALFPNASRQKIEIFYYFIAWGFIGLIQQNLRHPSAFSFKTLVSSAERIITEGVQFLAEPDG
ncbi:MAG: TetR/AcrR family transcriptional regulator [Ruminococcaceae bacterium]|nr:TetR/AcrR family transcriptional regulator [Oscillospiraceae bacterium]